MTDRNPNIDFPEGTKRFEPSERLLRQIQVYGGPFTANLKDAMERGYSVNQIGGPQVWNTAGVTVDPRGNELSTEQLPRMVQDWYAEQGTTPQETPAKGVYYYEDMGGESSLGTLAHEAIHAQSSLMPEWKVAALGAFYSRTLDSFVEQAPYLATSLKKSNPEELKKHEGKTFAEFPVDFLIDNFEELAERAAKEEAQNYERRVSGKYRAVEPTDQEVLQHLSDFELRVARWTRDARKRDAAKKTVLPKLKTLQKRVREAMKKRL